MSTYSRRMNTGFGYLDDVEEEDDAMDMSGWMSRSPSVKTRPRQRKGTSGLGSHTPEHTPNEQPGYHNVGYSPQIAPDPVAYGATWSTAMNPLWAHDDAWMPKAVVFSKTSGLVMVVLGATTALAVRDFGGRAGGAIMLGSGMYAVPTLGWGHGLVSQASNAWLKWLGGGTAHVAALTAVGFGAKQFIKGGN